jgi:hypothetical protein
LSLQGALGIKKCLNPTLGTIMPLLLAIAVLPLLLPAFSMLILTLAALRKSNSDSLPEDCELREHPRTATLIPAHNESSNVIPTIQCVRQQMALNDRIVVIADNCTDDTAQLARDAGAEVVERQNDNLRGKGYALACGVDYLRSNSPEVVLVVDADCLISPSALAAISARCAQTGHPVQMLDLMHTVAGSGLKLRVMEFAMVMKNHVRPRGSFRLGRACHLMGTGMAMPWSLISTADLATGHVAEDMKLGVEMAKIGNAPHFLETVKVSSAFVADSGIAKVQKSRWEHGHLATIAEELPGLLKASILQRNPALIVMAMDLMIPPVALYFLVLAGLTTGLTAVAWFWPAAVAASLLSTLAAGCFGLSIGLAWFFFGRSILSARELFTAPLYALWKVPVYLAYFMKKRTGWVRTKRESE